MNSAPDADDPAAGSEVVVAVDGDAGKRLDRWLADALPALSRSRLKALIGEGRIRLGGATVADPSHRVKPGDRAEISVPAALPAVPRAQEMALAVVYEDDELIVVDKPPGMVVHPAPGSPDRTLVNALLAHCGDSLSGIGGVRRPGIVHRLDKDTSGLMVAAKTDRAHAGLAVQFADHSIERLYEALVWGVPRPAHGRIDGAIGRSRHNRIKMAVVTSGGRAAVTHYRLLHRFADRAALVECRLETGRTHQVRVHLAGAGHPVIGDPVYGRSRVAGLARRDETAASVATGFARQALHAKVIGFRHPVGGAAMRFERPPPADFAALRDALEGLNRAQ